MSNSNKSKSLSILDSPADISEIEDCQANVILVVCDVNILFETEDLCIPDVRPVQKGAEKEQC